MPSPSSKASTSGAFGRLERRPTSEPMGDINMTPLIDVMLVLLVIFMISAPLMAGSLKLDLPKADAPASAAAPQVLTLAVDASGQIFVGEEPVSLEQLQSRANAAARTRADTEVHLRADQALPYGRVAELMAVLQKAGLTRIGFVTEAPRPAAPTTTAPGRP